MFTYYINENLSLRQIETRDAERIFFLTEKNRTYLREWLPWVDATRTLRDTKQFIKQMKKTADEQRGLTMVIIYQGIIVGMASYNSIDWANKITYIGYWLDQDYQGKGIMTKVVKALCNYAFRDLHLNRVEICAAVENWKSRSIPERLGFTLEGYRRSAEWLNDRYVDHAIYGLLKDEWVNKTS